MSPAEQSIEATVIVEVEPEINVTIKDDPITTAFLSDEILPVYMNPLYDLIHIVHIDLDNIPDTEQAPSGISIRVVMPIIFGKSVRGHKETFGRTSLAITNSISTSGIIGLVADTSMPYPLGDTE